MIRSLKIVLLIVLLAASGGWIAFYASGRAFDNAVADSSSAHDGKLQLAAKAPVSEESQRALKLLKVEPVKGYVGDPFTVTGEGFPGGATVEIFWSTVEPGYVTKAMTDNLEYHERNYDEKRVVLGRASADAQGRINAKFSAPEDFGEVHDIFAVIEGRDVARGGFRILRSASITPIAGPVGTPITVRVKGIGWRGFEQFMALRYDNKYTGEISAVTTKGSAVFQIRAAGEPGKHIIQLNNSTAYTPGAYLNTQQSPQAYIYAHLDNQQEFRFTVDVTSDNEIPSDGIQWPEPGSVAVLKPDAPRTTLSAKSILGAATLAPASGTVNTQATLSAKNLPSNTEVDLYFATARGNRMTPSGWNLDYLPLGKTRTAADGSLKKIITMPDDLGGWHSITIATQNRVLAEAPYYLEQSLVKVAPRRVKVGGSFTIQIKGVGWTELDNTLAITYDNAAIGYACGFNSNGDVTVNLVGTGRPGIHLIDLYPAIYRGKDRVPWNYQTPFLTYARDFPALSHGYRLPAYRLAIEVIE
ncbi:MAG TPA: hypothetical protein VF452_03350 [Candidatus Binatia bacterium]